jgi:nitrous oxidase accessory protein NosD
MRFNNKKLCSLIIIVTLTLIAPTVLVQNPSFSLAHTFQAELAKASTNQPTLVVPDDYSTISAAITNAPEGATILVKKGTYYENPVVDKTLTIQGEDPNNTIVAGAGNVDKGAKPVFKIEADNVKVSGFTIMSLNYSKTALYATGIILNGDNCTITNNNIVGTYYGVFCSAQSYTNLSHNTITGVLKDAIRFLGGSYNTFSENNLLKSTSSGIALAGYSNWVLNNNIMNNGRGIGLQSSYTVVFGNNITGNTESGFYYAASNCIISANQLASSKWGIYFTSYFANPSIDIFYDNNFVNNQHDVGADSSHIAETWNQSYPTGGNYWSNYIVTDSKSGTNQDTTGSDGIADSPYQIMPNNADEYPLVNPFDIAQAGNPPALPSAPQPQPTSIVAEWHCDLITAQGTTPDSTGNNPAILSPGSGTNEYQPILVQGENNQALRYNGSDYMYVAASPTLEIRNEVTIDAWVNVQQLKNVTYNNIFVDAAHSFGYPARVWGISMNGAPDGSIPIGALRGFISDTTGQLNEIATLKPVPFNEWIHVTFTRSLTTGMHIYINGVEQETNVTAGKQNPTGQIWRGTELYIGHDSISTSDEIIIRNYAIAPKNTQNTAPSWVLPVISATIVASIAVGGTGYFLWKKKSSKLIS